MRLCTFLSHQFRSSVTFTVAVSAAFLVLFNWRFWRETASIFWHGSLTDALFLLSLFGVLLFLTAAVLALIPGRLAMRITAALLCVIAAVSAYAADSLGIFIDKEMIRNLLETDRREAFALLNLRFALYALLLGALPALLILRTRIADIGWRRELLQRAGFLIIGSLVSGLMLFSFAPHYSSFIREHKSLRYLLAPGAALHGSVQLARNILPEAQAGGAVDSDGEPVRTDAGSQGKPLLVFLVVGETARHSNFQLGGYARPTNPELSRVDNLFYFRNVSSCGTSTAISLPCMFSHLGRDRFSVPEAARNTNLVDALAKAGLVVEWRDNNSGSKGVSARVKTTQVNQQRDTALCNEESCLDEILMQGVNDAIQHFDRDAVIIFHQIGSHGPAYYKRHPQIAEKFTPTCKTNQLQNCSPEEIRNAYDNSIVYTDQILARQIAVLQAASDRFDTALVYVSDHGESLGEKNLYLHGAPYVFAPKEQTHVPFILWMSPGYQQRFAVNGECLRQHLGQPYSHDNLYHTVLGMAAVRNAHYRPENDMLAHCRAARQSG